MKKSVKKLGLSRETLHMLTANRLERAVGGSDPCKTDLCTHTYHSQCCDDSVSCPASCTALFSCATCMIAGC